MPFDRLLLLVPGFQYPAYPGQVFIVGIARFWKAYWCLFHIFPFCPSVTVFLFPTLEAVSRPGPVGSSQAGLSAGHRGRRLSGACHRGI